MASFGFRLNGAALEALPDGVLWWPAEQVLAVADLHLEKASSYAGAGLFLPPYDSVAAVERLAMVIEQLRPAIVVALGDSFHDAGAEDRLPAAARERLAAMAGGRTWIWLEGNHDPEPAAGQPRRGFPEWGAGAFVLCHRPPAGRAGEVAGHLHPKVRVSARGRSLGGRCFVTDGRQLVLPAFGALAGGLDARDDAVRSLFAGRPFALLLGPSQVHPVRLRTDSRRGSVQRIGARDRGR
jgi:DNA ligase-associated metallophosphoesterase